MSDAPLLTKRPDAPASASARAYLRDALPAVYREPLAGDRRDPFAMRFVNGLEEVLDPIVTMVDLLPAHLDLDLAPAEIVALVGEWLGLELDNALTPKVHRRLVRDATSITRTRGTRAGIERVLRATFEHIPLEVRDSGRADWSSTPEPPPSPGEPSFIVVCPRSATAAERAAIHRVVTELKPAHVGFQLQDSEVDEA